MTRFIEIARAAAFAGLCSGCIVWSAAAFAADTDAPPQGRIMVGKVDFTSPRAVAGLQRQLRHVATEMCTQSGSTGLMTRSEQACYDTAVKDGLTQIDGRQQALREHTIRLAAVNNGAILAQ